MKDLRRNRKRTYAPAVKAAHNLWTRYRLRPAQLEELMTKQDKKCCVCLCDLTPAARPCVDHNHETGAVRGVLWHRCNIAIPVIEAKERFNRAIEYLRGHGCAI